MTNTKRAHSGFTLIEILVVIVILSVLLTVTMAMLSSARAKARDAARKQTMHELGTALQLYYADHGKYPTNNNANPMIIGGPSDYLSDMLQDGGYIPKVGTDPTNIPPEVYSYTPSLNALDYTLTYRQETTGKTIILKP